MSKSEHGRFLLLSLLCVALSLGGIWASVKYNRPNDGGRGGAIAVALSFAALFLTRSYGTMIHKLITVTLPGIKEKIGAAGVSPSPHADPVVAQLQKEIEALKAASQAVNVQLQVDAQGQENQNRYLAFSSVVGTISWGFGDMAAQHFLS